MKYLWSVVTSSHDAVLRQRLLSPQTQLDARDCIPNQLIALQSFRGVPGWGRGANVLSYSPNLAKNEDRYFCLLGSGARTATNAHWLVKNCWWFGCLRQMSRGTTNVQAEAACGSLWPGTLAIDLLLSRQ
jgi:hypothetical protein